jgi:hypothetical protein
MAAELPCFDGLLDSTQPRDTLVTIVEEGSATAATHDDTGQAHKRQRTAGNNLTLQAHWVVLWSLSPFFRAKVTAAATAPASLGSNCSAKVEPSTNHHMLYGVCSWRGGVRTRGVQDHTSRSSYPGTRTTSIHANQAKEASGASPNTSLPR